MSAPTFREPDLFLCDLLTHEMSLDPTRVVVYDENWEPPKDKGLYIVVMTGESEIIGVAPDFDPVAEQETMGVSMVQKLQVVVTSKDRTAIQRKEEVVMALTSSYSKLQQEIQQMGVFRAGDILDLSFIEGASALHRYQIPVRIFYTKTETSAVDVIDGFPDPQIEEEA